MKGRPHRLLGRIVFSFFALSAVIVLLLSVVTYALVGRDARAAVVKQLETLSSAKVQALESWMSESTKRVEFAATIDTVAAAAAAVGGLSEEPEAPGRDELRATLGSVLDRWPELGELLFAADRGGLVLAATTPEMEGGYRLHDSWFTRGREATYVQNVYPSPITLLPTLTVATPVLDSSGRRLGVLAANLDLTVLDRIVGSLPGPFPTAQSYLVDRFNIFVSAERFGSESFPRGVHSRGIDAAVARRSGSGVYTDYRGVSVIGVYRWIDEHDLALLVEAPTVDAFRRARDETAVIAAIGLAVVGLLAVGVFLLARRIAEPILAIEEAARRVAGGDLTARARVRSPDEIGALARSFNEMTENLGDLYAVLQWNEERFRALIEASSDMILVVDRAGSITYVSPSVERVIGYPASSLIGTSAMDIVHPEDAERTRAAYLDEVVASPSGESVSVEYRLRDSQGRWRTVEAVARNLLGYPSVDGILVNCRDVTERRHLEAELAQAQKMEAVGRLAGGIAHDFNNLLTAIMGYAELVQSTPELPGEAASGIAEITKAANRAAALTQQLLAYSRKQVLKPRVLDLNSLVQETATLLGRLIGEDIEVRTILDPALYPVEADATQLQRVIVNLAVNSRDAMPQGGVLTVRTRNCLLTGAKGEPELAAGPYVLTEVVDTGMGMDQATLGRLFEPFFTTKEVGKGTGLGLATVYGIVRQSGGQVTAESTLGSGTTFRIYLPPASASVAGAEAAREHARETAGTESILLVEDEEAVGRLMQDALARAGYRVVGANDPAGATALAERAGGFDLLVTDVIMPTMDGGKLASLLRERFPAMQVLFISGYTADKAVKQEDLGDELCFLQKPFTPAALVRRVRDILDRARTSRR